MEGRKDVIRLPQTITISTGTLFRVVLILVIFGFLYLIIDVLAILLASIFLAALIDPFADFFERWKIPRGMAALIVYIIGLAVVVGAFLLVVPPVLSELQNFFSYFAPFLPGGDDGTIDYAHIFSGESLSQNLRQIFETIRASGVSAAVEPVLELGSSAFGALATVGVVLILTFFIIAEKTALVRAVAFVAPAEYQPFVMQVAGKMRERLGSWLRGQLLLMLAVFLITYVALLILGIPYALILAILAGLLEIVPFLGPWLAGLPAFIIALAVSPLRAVLIVAVYIGIQMLEGNILVPKIMQKVSGLNPIISLLAVLIGWRVGSIVGGSSVGGGIMGVILAIPLVMACSVLLEEIFRNRSSISS